MSKIKNNAIASVQGITYQNLVALEKCFELLESQTLYIEIYGDVTVEKEIQTEVKHEQGYLSNLSHSFWKTISNWLDEDGSSRFLSYKELVLLTTQKLSADTLFKDFNEKNFESKLIVLNEIYIDYLSKEGTKSEKTLKYLQNVMDPSKRGKLKILLDKFILVTEAPSYKEIYERLCQTYTSFLSQGKEQSCVEALIGYVHNEIAQSNGKINYESFTDKKRTLNEQLMSSTFTFPAIYVNYKPSKEEELKALEMPLVKKIHDIDYYEDVGLEAIQHLYRQRKTVSEEMQGYESRDYDIYEDDLKNFHQSEYRLCSLDSNESTQIKDSKKFYNRVLASPATQFKNYIDTPIFFRNGYLHELINEDENMVWKLKVDGL